MRNKTRLTATLARRTGGLEKRIKADIRQGNLARRTGGLEINNADASSRLCLARRTGGLETLKCYNQSITSPFYLWAGLTTSRSGW